MATLQAIGYTIGGGAAVMVTSFLCFGIAVRNRSTYVAPRCTARPPETIYNPNPTDPSQIRGDPMFGWISWCNGLTYETLIQGVPGTGTRENGLKGSMLKVNLDGIVLLRFNELCLKMTLFISCVCLFVILPINLTASCHIRDEGVDVGCFHSLYNLTNYQSTTMANIPEINDIESPTAVFEGSQTEVYGRLYAIVILCWFIYYYCCKLLQGEWAAMLALRRVYFLEMDHWEDRQHELEETLLQGPPKHPESFVKRKNNPKTKKLVKERDPWIPHAEMRETVPNIALYSVLVGGLPASPYEEVDPEDIESAFHASKKKKVDWQLEFAGDYFDQCVPNQPGFSSSVAAITILPSAPNLARAWAKWYAAAGKLRRLRFIRSLIREKLHYEIEHGEDEEADGKSSESEDEEIKLQRRIYVDENRNKEYYRDVLGASPEENPGSFMAFDFGPEQTAVYSREFAQSAAACCPNGCWEGRLRRERIDRLRELEYEAELEVHAANTSLKKAQHRVVRGMDEDSTHCFAQPENDEEDEEESHSFLRRGTATMENLIQKFKRGSTLRPKGKHSTQWQTVERMFNERIHASTRKLKTMKIRRIQTGEWGLPSVVGWSKKKAGSVVGGVLDQSTGLGKEVTNTVADHLVRESTYAMVTFTSRQAAVAARQCLTDGRGLNRWVSSERIPVPPLADAAPFAIVPCRGCCRPVALTIHERQKVARKYVSMGLLATIYIFYTVPITAATALVDPERLERISPEVREFFDRNVLFSRSLAGILPALIWTLFFSLCPVMFKSIANFGSGAASVYIAEYRAMQYYWWFYLVTAFTGNLLSQMVLQGFGPDIQIGSEAAGVLEDVASTVPTVVSAQWLNWCIVRTTIVLPMHYLLQFNTFLFAALGMKCCSRLVRGGGPGGPVPYRIYIDSGVVFLCAVALAPAAPLVAPCTLVFFFFCTPLMKRNLLFVYRPKYDAGGRHWPFLFDMIMSSLLVGQILIVTMMALRRALGPLVLAALPIGPTILFRLTMRKQYFRAFVDASLFHTSELDGWDVDEGTSMVKREQFRKFLVDAHKASYVPVCLATSDEVVTVEPAVVVPRDNDEDQFLHSVEESPSEQDASTRNLRDMLHAGHHNLSSRRNQFGVSMRRMSSAAFPPMGAAAEKNEEDSDAEDDPQQDSSSTMSVSLLQSFVPAADESKSD